VVVALACLTSVPAAAGDGITATLLTSFVPAAPSVIADFDGDHRFDLATVGTLGSTRNGYHHQLDVQLNTAQSPVFTFLILPAANRLSALDLDGDNDRDLVLETPLRVPLAVWINDGGGKFHECNLDAFRFQLLHSDPGSLASSERLLPLLRTGECPRRNAALSHPFRQGPQPVGRKLTAHTLESPLAPKQFEIWTRGPPTA
jgi:hypothetical protein